MTSPQAPGHGEDVVTFAPPGAPDAGLVLTSPSNGKVPGNLPAASPHSTNGAHSTNAAKTARSGDNVVRSVGLALTLLAVAILGFVGYLYFLSGVQEARAQTTLYARLRGELANQVAPTGPMTGGDPAKLGYVPALPGDPVALLTIPAIGITNEVVVEGTSPENLTLGPGHLRDTPLPGQGGICVVFGRRATFGGPFGDLPQLRKGDLITAVTGQGPTRYQVIAVSDSSKPVPFSELPNQLLLVTADSAVAPSHYVEVEAKLLGSPQLEPGGLPAVGSSEVALGRDFYALIPAMAWAIALAAGALLGSLAAAKWARWPAWIVAVPVILAIVWNLYESLSALLPNLY
jgi:sortase A